ncbi:MAG: DUF433 domain-containing protein [Caldilineae bacterium]|nr:MAG: DUF433 domain-containing protein [Caldilineae bacterium]
MQTVLDRHIAISEDIRGGRPHIAGSRITVADIVIMHLRLGQGLAEIAGRYDLDLAAVYAAMAYYYDHRAEIDADIAADEAYAAAFQANHPSYLQEKLRRLHND